MKTKSEIRKDILIIRNNLDLESATFKSNIIINKIINTEEYKNSKSIMVYMDFKNEVNTKELISTAFKDSKKVIIPYTDIDTIEIIPVEIKAIDDLVRCKYGYLEPKKEMINKPYDIKEIDLIIVPGVVFDKNCNRIGFGKGYYDKLLINRKPATKAFAIAYDFQVLGEIPVEEHDIKMDKIITESKVYEA